VITDDIQFDIEFVGDHTCDYIHEKRFSIYNNSKQLFDKNELKHIIEICDEKLDLTNYTILGIFDITKCKKNFMINCSNTKLSNIVCSNLNIELKELKCLSNNLTEINNLRLNNLVRLFCGYNKIINLNELSQNMPNLKYLDCAGNPIVSLNNLPRKINLFEL
jgi:Leucine-rich repeat (LRR) protein